jgi:hypothetical protein
MNHAIQDKHKKEYSRIWMNDLLWTNEQ